MVQRRFPKLRVFRRHRTAQDLWQASSADVAAASWADTFRMEHADLVGARPLARPRRHRWLVAASLLGLVVTAAVLYADLRRVATGSQRGTDADQRRNAIAEAVSQELVRTREAFEAYRVQTARDLSTAQESLAERETALHESEQARRKADDLATERVRAVEAMTSDLALARREATEARTAMTEARAEAQRAAQDAQAVVRAQMAATEAPPRMPLPNPAAATGRQDEAVPTQAETRAEPVGLPGLQGGDRDAGEGPRFGRSNMAWLPLTETAFMALDASHAGPDTAPVATRGGGASCLDGLAALPSITSPPATAKGARSTRADARDAGPSRARTRSGVKTQSSQDRGAGAQQKRSPQAGAEFLTGW